ncbi:hypothetical protein F4818DRAFT_454789 [Hypoxylon cercidicola]|nr:hypothetical protein F4818DRAFT_454789 [Hypoxylon cercidicola]
MGRPIPCEREHYQSGRAIPPVDTAEEFHSRFSNYFREEHSDIEQELKDVFDFDPEYRGRQLFGDEHALIDFLSRTIPDRFKGDIKTAGPLLFKAMIRLGSFPFHNGPTRSTLGADEAFVAILFLVREYEHTKGFEFYYESLDDEVVRQRSDRYFHRLLFQVMSSKPEQNELSSRDPADDEDLIRARALVEMWNFVHDVNHFKIIHKGPPVEVSKVPSSRSRDLTGMVPKDEFLALLNVLCGVIDYTAVDVGQLVETYGTDWHGFEAIVTRLEPYFSSGIRQLLDIFVNYNKWLDENVPVENQGAETTAPPVERHYDRWSDFHPSNLVAIAGLWIVLSFLKLVAKFVPREEQRGDLTSPTSSHGCNIQKKMVTVAE